jgi:hypothetical protein
MIVSLKLLCRVLHTTYMHVQQANGMCPVCCMLLSTVCILYTCGVKYYYTHWECIVLQQYMYSVQRSINIGIDIHTYIEHAPLVVYC